MKITAKLLWAGLVIILLMFPTLSALAQVSGTVELVGQVEAMTLDTITVNGQVISITGAELNTPIAVGNVVKVEGSLELDGSISAREVGAAEDGVLVDEAELIGTLESFDGTTAIVNGQAIDVSGAEIKAGFVVGEQVKIHAMAVAANTWVAREAEPFVSNDDDTNDDNQTPGDEFELTGTLDEVGDGFIVISGQTIIVTDAEIKDMLVVGVLVKVHVRSDGDSLVAREVENATPSNDNQNANDNENTNANNNTNVNLNVNSNQNANNNTNNNANDNAQRGEPSVSAQEATTIVTGVFPNTTITELELDTRFGGTLVWEVKTSHGIELIIDATSGAILVIDRNDNGNRNDNNNNGNGNTNSNDNDDNDNGNSNSNDNDDNDNDDNSGMGSDDDDNSGMGSDDDDNSGMGSDDDD